jgi:hypothetical protein
MLADWQPASFENRRHRMCRRKCRCVRHHLRALTASSSPHQHRANRPRNHAAQLDDQMGRSRTVASHSDSSRHSPGRCLRPQLGIAVTALSNARSGCTLPVSTRPPPIRLHSIVTITSDGSRNLRLSPASAITLPTTVLGICKPKFMCSDRRAIRSNPSVSRKVANLAHSVMPYLQCPQRQTH